MWNYLEWGGAQIYLLAIMKRAKKDWNVRVFLPEHSSPDILSFVSEIGIEYELTTARLDNSPAATVKQKIKRQCHRIRAEISSLRKVWKYRKTETVIHVETAPWQSWLFLFALTLCGNVFVTVHNALVKTSGWREIIWKFRLKFLAKLNRLHILTANDEARESLRELAGDEFVRRVIVTRAGINPGETDDILSLSDDKTPIYQRLSLPNKKFTVLSVGQFIDRKGRWIFLEAAEKLLNEYDDLAFVWLMPNLPDGESMAKIEKMRLKNSFYPIFSSSVGRKRREILQFIGYADLFVLPSLLEGLPISLLEAMALKKACISSRINAIPEAIIDRQTGWLIESGDSDALAEAIFTLKNDNDLRKKIGENAREFVIRKYDEREMAELVIGEYEKSFD